VPELERLGRTISAWEEQLLVYFSTGGVSNGPTAAVNLLVKRIKRAGFGFRNFANYRLRLLLRCGVSWHTHRPTRIRGRSHVLWRRAQLQYNGSRPPRGRFGSLAEYPGNCVERRPRKTGLR
jgi:Transposase